MIMHGGDQSALQGAGDVTKALSADGQRFH
jgi:hypothetical protein